MVASKEQQLVLILKMMIKTTPSSKSFPSKTLHLTYKQFISNNKSLTGFKIGNYIVLHKLGQGSFGAVFCGINQTSNYLVAIKVIDLEMIQIQPNFQVKKVKRRLAKTQTELMLKCNKSQNLAKCYDVFQNKSLKLIIMQYCNQGSLQDKIDEMVRIPQSYAIELLTQILNGLSELHKNRIIHRDLKPQNILIHQGDCKIADFGFSKQLLSNDFHKQLLQTNLGTPSYMAPEVYYKKKYGLNADIWSVGVIYYTMLFGKCPFQKMSKKQLEALVNSEKIFQARNIGYDVKISPESKQFILECLQIDSQKRLNWQNIICHTLFNMKNPTLQTLESSSGIFSSKRSQTLLDVKTMKALMQNDITSDEESAESERQDVAEEIVKCEKQNAVKESVKCEIQNAKKTEIIRVHLLPPQQFAKIQQQTKKLTTPRTPPTEILWSQSANFQCLKTEFILEQIIERLQYLPSKISESKQIIQIMYLISARCFQDISVRYKERQHHRKEVITGFLKIIENVYRESQKKLDILEAKKSSADTQMIDVIKNTILGFFGQNKVQDKERIVFLACDKKKAQSGLPMGTYTKTQQIKFTQKCLDKQVEKISKQVEIPKNVLKYMKNYEKIVSLTAKDVGEVYFKTYVTNFLINQ